MTPPNRRDTPPAGVPADDGEWETSDVHEQPPQRPTYVSTPTPPSSPRMTSQSDDTRGSATKASARAAFREIRKLGEQLEEHSKSDGIALSKIHEKLEAQDEVLTEQNKLLTDIRIDASGTRVAVDLMRGELLHKREIQKIKIEGELTTGVEKEKTERERMSNRTKIILALVAVLSTGIGALVKWLVG